MAAILAAAFPVKAPHFFAYLRTITKASRTFESSAWASYDMAFRRQAANRGSLDWGLIGVVFYSEALTLSRQANAPVSLLLGQHSLFSGVSARSGGTPNGPHCGGELSGRFGPPRRHGRPSRGECQDLPSL